MLLAGVGNVDTRSKRNYYVFDGKCDLGPIEEAFKDLTQRRDIAILLINQHVCGPALLLRASRGMPATDGVAHPCRARLPTASDT